jgi:hypothetical protein
VTVMFLVIAIIFGLSVLYFISRLAGKAPKRNLNQAYYQGKWIELLARVRTPEGMMHAIIDAYKLIDDLLKKKHFKGKTMGERLVSAQRSLSDNDSVWYAHKLRNRLVHEPEVRLKKREAQTALAGFRRGLKDLGAL